MRFLNYLVNDCIYLLDEALKALPALKAAEAARASPAHATLPPHQRLQRECAAPALLPRLTLSGCCSNAAQWLTNTKF